MGPQQDGSNAPLETYTKHLIPAHGKLWRDIAYSIGVRDSAHHRYGLVGRHKKAMAARKKAAR